MKKIQEVDMDWKGAQDRLDHYNKWLMDPKRPIDSIYPGYPGDVVTKTKQKRKVTVAKEPKLSYNEASVKENEMTKVTKLSQATELVKGSASKQEAIDKIVDALGVTRSNAFVYYTKAVKALGVEPTADKPVKVAKAKTAKVRTSDVTELSEAKHKAKVAEIDKVIAGLKASGATVASPFAGL